MKVFFLPPVKKLNEFLGIAKLPLFGIKRQKWRWKSKPGMKVYGSPKILSALDPEKTTYVTIGYFHEIKNGHKVIVAAIVAKNGKSIEIWPYEGVRLRPRL